MLAINTKRVLAQGTFNCVWSNNNQRCQVETFTTCSAGYVASGSQCSGIDQPSCESGNPHTCTLGPCGGAGQTCCPNLPSCASNNYACDPATNTCQLTNQDCGARGEPCCPGSNCDQGLSCNPYSSRCEVGSGSGGTQPAIQDPSCTGQPGTINTAIGCIPFADQGEFVGFILGWAIGIGGGVAFLLIIYAGFQILTSTGNPERLKAGRELLTSAVAGLILLIFSIFILRIIGVDILRIF